MKDLVHSIKGSADILLIMMEGKLTIPTSLKIMAVPIEARRKKVTRHKHKVPGDPTPCKKGRHSHSVVVHHSNGRKYVMHKCR